MRRATLTLLAGLLAAPVWATSGAGVVRARNGKIELNDGTASVVQLPVWNGSSWELATAPVEDFTLGGGQFVLGPLVPENRSGTNPPATCTTGDLYVDTDEGPGQVLFLCTAPNVWQRQGVVGNMTTKVLGLSTSATEYFPVHGGSFSTCSSSLATGTISVDPGSIAATTRGSIGVTLTGVASGDEIILYPPSGVADDLLYVGHDITATNAVTLYFYNPTGSAINDAATTWKYAWRDCTGQSMFGHRPAATRTEVVAPGPGAIKVWRAACALSAIPFSGGSSRDLTLMQDATATAVVMSFGSSEATKSYASTSGVAYGAGVQMAWRSTQSSPLTPADATCTLWFTVDAF